MSEDNRAEEHFDDDDHTKKTLMLNLKMIMQMMMMMTMDSVMKEMAMIWMIAIQKISSLNH